MEEWYSDGTANTFYGATDGSSTADYGTYAWTLHNTDGTSYAQHSGLAYGDPSTSFRSESYGLLSLLLFWEHSHQYTGRSYIGSLTIFVDSQSLITRLTDYSTWYDNFGTITMQPDWDLSQAICTKLRTIQPSPQLQHVSAHQASSIYDDKPLPQRLNAHADTLASTFIPSDTSLRKTIPLISGAICQLHCNQTTIPSQYASRIRKYIVDDNLQHFLQRKYGWSAPTLKDINWKVHTAAITWSPLPSSSLTKFLYQWLPLRKNTHRFGTSPTSSCPTCNHKIEDTTHFLHCSGRDTWRNDLIECLTKHFTSNHIDPWLQNFFFGSMKLLPPQPLLDIPSSFRNLSTMIANCQNMIGYSQMWYGRLTHEWAHTIDTLLHVKNITPNSNAILTTAVDITWHHVYQNWTTRNADLHRSTIQERETRLYEQAVHETTALYKHRHLVLPRDCVIFYASLDDHLTTEATSQGLCQCLNTWQPLILHSINEASRTRTYDNHSITSFFDTQY